MARYTHENSPTRHLLEKIANTANGLGIMVPMLSGLIDAKDTTGVTQAELDAAMRLSAQQAIVNEITHNPELSDVGGPLFTISRRELMVQQDPAQPEGGPTPIGRFIVQANGVNGANVRSEANTRSGIVDTVVNGTVLDVYQVNSTNDWFLVRLPDGREGWMSSIVGRFVEPEVTAAPNAPDASGTPEARGTADAPVERVENRVIVSATPSHETVVPVLETPYPVEIMSVEYSDGVNEIVAWAYGAPVATLENGEWKYDQLRRTYESMFDITSLNNVNEEIVGNLRFDEFLQKVQEKNITISWDSELGAYVSQNTVELSEHIVIQPGDVFYYGMGTEVGELGEESMFSNGWLRNMGSIQSANFSEGESGLRIEVYSSLASQRDGVPVDFKLPIVALDSKFSPVNELMLNFMLEKSREKGESLEGTTIRMQSIVDGKVKGGPRLTTVDRNFFASQAHWLNDQVAIWRVNPIDLPRDPYFTGYAGLMSLIHFSTGDLNATLWTINSDEGLGMEMYQTGIEIDPSIFPNGLVYFDVVPRAN